MSKVNFEVKEGALVFGVDPNEDGQAVVSGKVNLSEAVQEAFSKGEKVEGVKVASVEFQLTKMVIKLDTDKDGEELLTLEVDLAEAVDETSGIFKK